MKEKEVVELVNHWMPILRVNDWKFKGLLWNEKFFKDKEDVMCAVNFNYFSHTFTLNMRRKAQRSDPHEVEFIVIHELIHLLLYPLDYIVTLYEESLEIDPRNNISDSIIDDLRYKETEIAINKLATALQAAYGKYKKCVVKDVTVLSS